MATLRIVFAGCLTGIAALAASPAAVTFNKDVLPILEKNCQSCHRPGEATPMSLLTYQDDGSSDSSFRGSGERPY